MKICCDGRSYKPMVNVTISEKIYYKIVLVQFSDDSLLWRAVLSTHDECHKFLTDWCCNYYSLWWNIIRAFTAECDD